MSPAGKRCQDGVATAIIVAFGAGAISATLLILRALAKTMLETQHLQPDPNPIMTAVWTGARQIPPELTIPGTALFVVLCGIFLAASAVSDIQERNKPSWGLYAAGYIFISGGVGAIFMQFPQTDGIAATLVATQMALLAICWGIAGLRNSPKQNGGGSRIGRTVRHAFRHLPGLGRKMQKPSP